jgi:hypothetical protein
MQAAAGTIDHISKLGRMLERTFHLSDSKRLFPGLGRLGFHSYPEVLSLCFVSD